MFFHQVLIALKAFLEEIGLKRGYKCEFEKEFGFEPPKPHNISSDTQKEVKSKLMQTAKQTLAAQKCLEEGDYEKFYYPSVDDFQSSSAWDKIPPPLLERNKKKGNYEKMKELAEKAGFCVLEDPRIQEIDEKMKDMMFSFTPEDSVPSD